MATNIPRRLNYNLSYLNNIRNNNEQKKCDCKKNWHPVDIGIGILIACWGLSWIIVPIFKQ
jgi:hypothetical protein